MYQKKAHGGRGRGQFEHLIDLTKQRLYKSIGRFQLTYSKLEEMLFDIQIN